MNNSIIVDLKEDKNLPSIIKFNNFWLPLLGLFICTFTLVTFFCMSSTPTEIILIYPIFLITSYFTNKQIQRIHKEDRINFSNLISESISYLDTNNYSRFSLSLYKTSKKFEDLITSFSIRTLVSLFSNISFLISKSGLGQDLIEKNRIDELKQPLMQFCNYVDNFHIENALLELGKLYYFVCSNLYLSDNTDIQHSDLFFISNTKKTLESIVKSFRELNLSEASKLSYIKTIYIIRHQDELSEKTYWEMLIFLWIQNLAYILLNTDQSMNPHGVFWCSEYELAECDIFLALRAFVVEDWGRLSHIITNNFRRRRYVPRFYKEKIIKSLS